MEVNVTFSHESFRDLDIELVSPSGARSQLTVAIQYSSQTEDPTDFRLCARLTVARFVSDRRGIWARDPNGNWQLQGHAITTSIYDRSPPDSWSIKVYGHSGTPVDTSACATGGAVANTSTNPGLVSDCETLLEARDALVGTGTSLNWSASTPMTAWDGITVEGTPARATQISLQNRGLSGTIPAQLGSLTALRGLRIDTIPEVCQGNVCRDTLEHERNRLTGPIPPALGRLHQVSSFCH